MPRRKNILASRASGRVPRATDTAVIYCRVSTQDQADRGVGLEVQQAECERFIRDRNLVLADDGVFIEHGESGKTIDGRPALQRLLAYCQRRRPSAVVIYNTDRISRQMDHHGVIRYRLGGWGVQLLSATERNDDSAAGRFASNVLAAASQFDNQLRAEKVTKAMQLLEEQGYWVHQNPTGYVFAEEKGTGRRILVPDPDVAPLITDAFVQMATGQYTQREVREHLEEKGLRNRVGNPYSIQGFANMLRNCTYAGLIQSKWTPVPIKGRHEALVSEATFLRVQTVLLDREPLTQRHVVARPEFPLRRFAFCGRTGKAFTGGFARGRNGTRYPYYFPNRFPSGSKSVPAKQLEAAFLAFLGTHAVSPALRPVIESTLRALWAQQHADSEKLRKSRESVLERLRGERTQLTRKLAQGMLSDADYRDAVAGVAEEITRTEAALAQMPKGDQGESAMLRTCLDWLENLAEAWKRGGYAEKQRLQSLLFPEGVTYENGAVQTTRTSHLLAIINALRDPDSSVVPPVRDQLNRGASADESVPSLVARVRQRFSAQELESAFRDVVLLAGRPKQAT